MVISDKSDLIRLTMGAEMTFEQAIDLGLVKVERDYVRRDFYFAFELTTNGAWPISKALAEVYL